MPKTLILALSSVSLKNIMKRTQAKWLTDWLDALTHIIISCFPSKSLYYFTRTHLMHVWDYASLLVLKEIFRLAYDQENHFSISKTYSSVVTNYFVPYLLQAVKTYISRCPKCLINKTLQDKAHGLSKPIVTRPVPFYTLTMDFILALLLSRRFGHGEELFDVVISITNKFTKAVKVVSGKNIYTVTDWTSRYWQMVFPKWGFPSAILSDRDVKFLSEFWKSLFAEANTRILTSTAYHLKTDGQSERTNQMVEIALCYYVSECQNDWTDTLDIV